MTIFIIRDKESGYVIEEADTYQEALEIVEKYENEDKKNGDYTPDYYEIVEN